MTLGELDDGARKLRARGAALLFQPDVDDAALLTESQSAGQITAPQFLDRRLLDGCRGGTQLANQQESWSEVKPIQIAPDSRCRRHRDRRSEQGNSGTRHRHAGTSVSLAVNDFGRVEKCAALG